MLRARSQHVTYKDVYRYAKYQPPKISGSGSVHVFNERLVCEYRPLDLYTHVYMKVYVYMRHMCVCMCVCECIDKEHHRPMQRNPGSRPHLLPERKAM